jgi:quinohemoprotein ethanol dehydrogenase
MGFDKKWLPFLVLSILLAGWITAAQSTRVDKVNDRVLRDAGKTGEEWLTHGLNYAEQRFSPLKQIDATNVGRLGLAWSYELGTGGGQQSATPLVVGGVIYAITNWSIAFAVDARTGKELWRYDPEVDRAINASGSDRLCCGVLNRGVAVYEGKVIVPVNDGRLIALDAVSGKRLWSVQATPPGDVAYSLTMAPRVVKGKIIIGNAGAEFPPYRGYFSAFDPDNGRELWRFYVVPGDPSKKFENRALEKAAKTWTGEWWKFGGGGSVWDGFAYDPDANLIYVGTGNGTPWSYEVRQGKGHDPHLDNLYIASVLAVNPDNGELKWHYQFTPADEWDYDATQHLILADLRINGRDRKVVMQANKNGFFYVLDRITGELVSAEPFALVSWATGIDKKTGRPMVVPEAYYTSTRGVTVAPVQGHGASPMAFSPITGLVYFPGLATSTFSFTADDNFQFTPGNQTFGLNMRRGAAPLAVPPAMGPVREFPAGGRGGAMLSAWDPVAQKERWFAPGGGSNGGGALATAGNLVFQVLNDGRLVAYSADKGEKLHEIATGQRNGMGPPTTFMLDGKQYVAVMGGQGRVVGGGIPGVPPPPAPATPAPAPIPPRLYVYALDANAPLPPSALATGSPATAASAPRVAAVDVTGTWTSAFDTQIGEQKYTYTFQVKGSELTGTAVSNFGKAVIKNGKVDGDTVTFVELLDFMGMLLEIPYTGKIVSEDQIDFTRQIPDVAAEKLVAKRVR